MPKKGGGGGELEQFANVRGRLGKKDGGGVFEGGEGVYTPMHITFSLFYNHNLSTRYSDRLHHFYVTIPRCYKDAISTVSFLAQLDPGILCL